MPSGNQEPQNKTEEFNSANSDAKFFLASIVESSQDSIITIDLNGNITSWNKAAEHLYGYPAQEALGNPLAMLILPKDLNEVLGNIDKIKHRERIETFNTVRLNKNGREMHLEIVLSPVKNASGQVIGVSTVARDITGRIRMESDLKESNRLKDEFLATLAHELRNPLAPIRSGLEVVRGMTADNPKLEKTLDIIERQTNQIIHLVDDLLDISRITQGKIKLKKSRVELRTAIEMALDTSQELIDEAGNELTVTLPYKPIFIDADLARVAQIFLNILNNAAKYSIAGGKITLAGKAAGNEVVISIKDTGLGIAPEMLPKIFEMFGQIETSEEQARGGLGIGLSVVKKLVEMHGGGIEAMSEGLGKGSEFIVRLPLAAEQSKSLPAAPISETDILQTAQMNMPGDGKENDSPAPDSHFRILVVDDNTDAAELLETLLSMQGHLVRTAFDAPEGIEIAGEFAPEICLSDIGLPGMNGYELAAQLREMLPHALLISISGWGRKEDRQKSKAAGFNYHLVKPVQFEDLLKLIELDLTDGK